MFQCYLHDISDRTQGVKRPPRVKERRRYAPACGTWGLGWPMAWGDRMTSAR